MTALLSATELADAYPWPDSGRWVRAMMVMTLWLIVVLIVIAYSLAYEMRVGQAVNGSSLVNLSAAQDVVQHRLLASVIVYF